jgi:hypothetical protein
MKPFTFQAPPNILFEAGASRKLAELGLWSYARSARYRQGRAKCRSERAVSHLYGHFGLVRLSRLGHDVSWVKAWSFVREPDAGNLPVRFDERGVKTGPWPNQ